MEQLILKFGEEHIWVTEEEGFGYPGYTYCTNPGCHAGYIPPDKNMKCPVAEKK